MNPNRLSQHVLKQTECQCCSIQAIKMVGKVGEYEQTFCKSCGYVQFINSFDQVNHQLYESDTDYKDDLSVAKDFEDLIQWNHKKAFQYLNKKYPSRNVKILDVGCFSGFFVKKLILQGFVARGIDFNNKALSFGKEHYGLEKNISNLTLEELLVQGEKYDVITLFEVIEHLESISDLFSAVSKLLKDDGVIIISIDGEFRSGGIIGVTVKLTDSSGEVISRMKIKNGDRNATVKNTDEFTRYIGDSIINEIGARN
jgi:2-polyprenyl-3-methyl-5-hydroxy-6-metoxy-1,4-benzoquinol methylase